MNAFCVWTSWHAWRRRSFGVGEVPLAVGFGRATRVAAREFLVSISETSLGSEILGVNRPALEQVRATAFVLFYVLGLP